MGKNKVILILVEVIIFVTVIGVIASNVLDATTQNNTVNPNANMSGTVIVLIGLTTLFVVIGFVVGLLKTLKVGGR